MSARTYSSHILSLLHFNYPYYAETGDGLTDEIGTFSWTRSGNAKLAGSEIPADLIISGTPRFGYRCLHTEGNSDFITGTAPDSYHLAVNTITGMEASLWLRVSATSAGNIMLLQSGVTTALTLALTADNKITASASTLGLNITTSSALTLGVWTHIKFQISGTQCRILVNDSTQASATVTASLLPNFNGIQLGGIHGEIDEFILRDTFTSGVPTEPEKAVCNAADLGGFGTGKLGDVVITSDCVMNSEGVAQRLSSGYEASSTRIGITTRLSGKFGEFSTGDEVMFLQDKTGEYCFRTLVSVESKQNAIWLSYLECTLNKAVEAAFLGSGTRIIQIPNFKTLTVNSGVTVSATAWTGYIGGIVAFRCQGNCTINGSIITSGKGRTRTDTLQLTHSKLVDTFITNTGGGIFIMCGGTFTAGSSARLGATWDGSGTGGVPAARSKGGNGGAGYGGAGGSDTDNNGLGGKGGVGGGGGGGNNAAAQDAGVGGDTGGKSGGSQSRGGTQGKDTGGNSPTGRLDSGGGGAGGRSGNAGTSGCEGVSSGANIILITKTLKADSAAISTGGEGGNTGLDASGGGGTGFCYIACEEMLS